MNEAEDKMLASGFIQTAGVLSGCKDAAREAIQENTKNKMSDIIDKLETDKDITSEDLCYVRLWIVGDAESHTKMENNFEEWLHEYERLKSVLAEYENKKLSADDLFSLQGVLEDATRITYDITNFLEKKERINRFKEAIEDTRSLDPKILRDI